MHHLPELLAMGSVLVLATGGMAVEVDLVELVQRWLELDQSAAWCSMALVHGRHMEGSKSIEQMDRRGR